MSNASADKRVPVRVLTGFLGSGKTTLLNYVLSANHGLGRVGIIENEYGEVGIDGKVVIAGRKYDNKSVIELSNGCLCCTVRGDLKRAVLELVAQDPPVDSILIETTGVANPGPVVQTFIGDVDVASACKLQGIITVVDAKHVQQHLETDPQVASQIAFADLLIINKLDLVPPSGVADVRNLLAHMNPSAELFETVRCKVPSDKLENVKWFDGDKAALISDNPPLAHDICSVTLRVSSVMSLPAMEMWLSSLVSKRGDDYYRYKGVMEIKGAEGCKYVFQGVHQVFGGEVIGEWRALDGPRQCEMVFIGRNLNKEELQAGLERCVAPEMLRFAVGAEVQCSTPAGWQNGKVLAHWQQGNAYLVQLKSGIPNIPGRKVFAPVDTSTFIKEL